MSGKNLAWTRITPEVYVSTAAVHYPDEPWGERWQIETMIFTKDPRVSWTQRIHGSVSSLPAPRMEAKALRAHGHIVENLTKLLRGKP